MEVNESGNESRLTENVFKNNENEILQEENPNKNKKMLKKIIIICSIIIAIIGIVIIILICTLKNNKGNDELPYDPIPEYEDLDFTEEAHRLLSREIATQSMVLATNNDILPLTSTDQVVLFGLGTSKTVYGGTGSGIVYQKGTKIPINPVMVLEGIQNKKDKFIYVENDIGYELGTGIDYGKNLTDENIKEFSTKREGAKRTIAILTISRISGEGSDRSRDSSSEGTLLSKRELDTFDSIKKYFDKIVLVLNVPSVIELNGLEQDKNVSILIAFLPGMEAGNAIADILVGDVNPSGHLTDTWAKTIDDYPTTSTFSENIKYVKYKEGIFVGYRYFEDNAETQKKVVFPFGYGLSYTTFNIESKCEYDQNKKIFTVTSKVTNTGKRSGKQVVQVYVKKPENKTFIKAQRELVAFNKTKEIKPGEVQELTMTFELKYLSSYDDIGVTGNPSCYVLDKGYYDIYVGDSVMATRNAQNIIYTYTQNEIEVLEKLTNRLIPKDPDVFDANTKPDFNDLFFDNDQENYECTKDNIINNNYHYS